MLIWIHGIDKTEYKENIYDLCNVISQKWHTFLFHSADQENIFLLTNGFSEDILNFLDDRHVLHHCIVSILERKGVIK